VTRLLDYDNRTRRHGLLGCVENPKKTIDHMGRPRVVKPEQDHAHSVTPGQGENLPKVEIEGQQNPVLCRGFLEESLIGQTMQALLSEMYGLVCLFPQPLHDTNVHAHVREKSHPQAIL
jgi:hypothetical protein